MGGGGGGGMRALPCVSWKGRSGWGVRVVGMQQRRALQRLHRGSVKRLKGKCYVLVGPLCLPRRAATP